MKPGLRLPKSAQAWRTPDFSQTLKRELEALGLDELPLQQGLSASSVALDDWMQAIILSSKETSGIIHIHAGLFYTGVVAGCSCADDPTPLERENEYCEILIRLDHASGEAKISLAQE